MTGRGTRTLVLGGVRSGKSDHGESLVADAKSIRYLATGPTTTTDRDWVERVSRHRARRDERYVTVETTDLVGELRAHPTAPTLVDDLGNWVSAQLDTGDLWSHPDDVAPRLADLVAAIRDFDSDLVLISPEVGLSVVPSTATGRTFCDQLGTLNTEVAAICDRVVLVVAGRVLELPPPTTPTRLITATEKDPTPSEPVAPATAAATTTVPRTGSPGDDSAGSVSTGAAADADRFDSVTPPYEDVAEAARARHLTLTKPPGSLGRLEEIGVWISACQGVCPPRHITDPHVVVFAGDHGVAQGGVSAFPPEVTAQMVANITAGSAAVNVLAARSGATVRVVDMAVDADTPPEVQTYKVRRGSDDLRVTDALTADEARAGVAAGRAIVDELVDSGADLLIAGDMGIGNTTPAAVLVGTLTRREPVEVVGRGTGIDDVGWMRKTAAVRDGMWRARAHLHDPTALLAAVGGADLAAMAGFLAQAAVRRTPVLLDGVVVTAAALVAADLAPGSSRWWLASHRSVEPAHTLALEHLGLDPVLELSMRLGEGTGALTALPTVCSAVEILTSMATFDEAGVSGVDDRSADTDLAAATTGTPGT